MIVSFLMVMLPISLSYSYNTLITSNYSATTPSTAPNFYAGSVSLLSEGESMNYTTSLENTITYPVAFDNSPEIILTLAGFIDNSTRDVVNFYLSSSALSGPTQLILSYVDGSIPFCYNYMRVLKVRILTFDPTLVTNIRSRIHNLMFTTSNITHFNDYADLQADKFTIKSFLIGIHFDLRAMASGLSYSCYTSVTIINQNQFQVSVLTDFPMPYGASTVQLWVQLLLYSNIIDEITAQFGVTYLLGQTVTLTPGPNIFYIIGIKSFLIQWPNQMYFQLTSQLTQLVSLPMAEQREFQWVIIKDDRLIPPVNPALKYSLALVNLKSFSTINSSFTFVYENADNVGDISSSQFILDNPKINVVQAYLYGNKMYVQCSFSEDVNDLPLKVKFVWVKDNVQFIATTDLVLTVSPPLKIYTLNPSKYISIYGEVIQYFFLAGWAISLLSLNFIQLAFYGLIPLNTENPFLMGLTKMNFVSGYNIKFPNLVQQDIPSNYSLLRFSSNFLSNVNIMLGPIVVSLLMSVVLYLASKVNNSYKHKPRLLQYSVACLGQWTFSFLLFNSYNIFSSLVIDIEFLGTKSITSIVSSVTISLLVVSIFPIYAKLRLHYSEFNNQLNSGVRIGNLSTQTSTLISKMYPLVMALEMILIPCFLASFLLLKYSLYISLFISILPTVFAFLFTPYTESINNIRLLAHRVMVNLLIVFLIVCQKVITMEMDFNSSLVNLPWIILVMLTLNFLINFSFIVWKLIVWIKKPGIVDMKLFIQQKGPSIRPQIRALIDDENAVWIPRNQFAVRRQKRIIKKEGKQEYFQKRMTNNQIDDRNQAQDYNQEEAEQFDKSRVQYLNYNRKLREKAGMDQNTQ